MFLVYFILILLLYLYIINSINCRESNSENFNPFKIALQVIETSTSSFKK